MSQHRLRGMEKDAISSILDEAESEIFGFASTTSPSLRALDDQCRILFPEWDRSLATFKSSKEARNEVSVIDFDSKLCRESDPDTSDLVLCDASSRPSICEIETIDGRQASDSSSQESNVMGKIVPSPGKMKRIDKRIEDLKHERVSIRKDIAKVKRQITESQATIEQLKAKFRRSEQIRIKMNKTLGA